ncbi:unnamed protein product [Sphagnum troendelagicum]
MGNPSPGSKLKKTTTPPPKTIHRRAPLVTSLSLDHSIGKDVASPEKSNGAGRSVASTPSSAGGSGEKGISPAAKDSKLRRRIRSSLGGSEDFVLGDDFNNAGTPAEEKRITSPAEEKKSTPPPMEEKKHPFLLARGGIGRNGIRSGSPSQPLQSQTVKPRITTPPSKEKTALGRVASASTYSPKKLDMNSKKSDKEVSLTKSATAKSVKVQGDSVAIGRPKQNQSVKLHATRKLVAGDNSCLPTSSDMLTSSKPDLGGSLISEPLASEDSTRPEIMESVEVPVYSEGEPEELTSMEVDHAEDDQLHLPILDTAEKTAAVPTNLQPSLEYAQEEPSVHRLKSETSFGQDNDIPNYLSSEEESNPQVNLEALHSSDTELTSASLTSLMPPSFQGIHVEQEGQVARPDYDFAGCPPSEEVTKFEEIQEGLESADTDERKFTLQTLQSIPSDLSGQKQGLNDTDIENAVVSTMNHLSTCELPDNASSAQEHQVDLHVADTMRSASTCAISSESSAFKLAGAQEEVFSRPAISEELRVSRNKDILTGFSSEVLSSPEVSHTPITQQEFGKIDASNNAVATFQQEVVGLPSDTSLEWSTTLDADEDHDMSRDLNKAGSLCVALMPNLVCHSAEDSGCGGDVNQNLTAATRQNDLLYPSKDVESHTDVDLLEQDSHELRTGTTAFPLDNDQETYKNQLYTFHSGTSIDSLDGFHDVTSEQTTASSICTQETGIQAGTSVLAQQPELGLEEAPSITNANQELSASMGMTPIMFNISPALDTSPELCNASPVPSPKQECEATLDSAASFFKETWSSSDDEGAAKISKELTSFASDAGDANFLTFSGETANEDLEEAADIQDESCQDSVTRVMDLNRSVELLDCPKSEKGNSSRVQEVLEEGLTNDPENCKFAEEATHNVDEESTDCLLPEPLKCPKSENETSPKIQEISEEGLTNIPDKGACAEKARHRLDGGITHSLLQEPLNCLENCALPELQELSEEGLTCIPDKAVACAEKARQTVDEGSTLSLLLEPLDYPKLENATSKNIQEVSDNGLANIAENGAHADEARHGVNEGRKAGLVQELLDSRNGTSPKIKEVSEEGVINTPEKGTCAEEATDSVGEGITPCLLQEQLHCQKSGNNISLESQEVSEGVTITLENGTCAPETAHSVDEGSTTSLLKESSLIPVEMGVGAPVVFAEDIFRETGSAVQKDLIPADGGEPTKEVPHATGDVKAPAPAAGNVQPLHVDTQAEAVGVVLHQELGGDEKLSSTTAQDLLAREVLRDTDNVLGDLGMAADPGVAPSPMKPVETRPTTVAGLDTVFGMEAGESPVSMDCMFGSAAEDTDEGQIERLDSMESLDPELSTEEDPGNLKDDESSGSSLLQNDLASFQGLVSLNDHADFTSEIAEKSDTSNMSEASLDMPEAGRVADVVLHLSTEHDPTIENSSAIPPQGPVTDRDPTLVVGTVATNTSMVVSSIPDNGERGEHHSDPLCLGESQKPEVSEVNLCKQEEDIAGEVAAHMTPPLETRHAPTLQDKSGFHPEESMVEDIVGKGVDSFAREVYLEAHPVETPGNEENLNCLNKLPTSHEANESDTMVSVATQDNFERHLQESILEMLKDERSESNVKQDEQWSLEEQYMFVAAGSNDSAVSMESLDSSEALPMTNQEKREESSAEVLEILEDDRSDTALKEQEQRSFEEQPMFSAADSNDSDVLMGSLDNSEAFSVANLEKQEESSADTLEMLDDDGFESEADYQEQRSLEEQPTFVSADSNDSAVLMESLDNSEAFSVINHEKQEESSADALEMHRDVRFESEVDYQEQRSLEEQPMFISADSNYPAVLMENLDNTEPFPMTSQEKQQESSAEALDMLEDDRPAIEVNYQEQQSLKEQLVFVAADSNDSAELIESLDNSEALPVANQEKQEESSAEALEMLEDARSEGEVSEQEARYVEEEQAMFVAANSNDSAMLMKSLHNSGAFPTTNQEKQEEITVEGPEMLVDGRAESEFIEQEQRSLEEKQSKVFAAYHNDSALLTVSLDNSEAFPMNNQEKQDGRAESKAIEQEQRSLEEKESKVFAGDSNDTAVLTRSLDNSEAFPMTNQEKQDKSSAESLEMAEDDRLESEVSEEEQIVLEDQPMLVGSDSHDSALVTENLDNPEIFPVTNQEKQEESSAKALEMLQNNRSEMEAQGQDKSFLEEQSMFVAVDSNDSAVLTKSLDNSEAFPVTNWEQQEESSAEALELPEDSRSETEVIEQEQRSAEKERPIFVTVDSNDSVVLMESLDNSKAFPVTNHEKEEETSACLEIPVDDRSEMEVQEQEKGSLGEQSIFVVVDSNDPVTNQEKQEEVSAEGLEMLEVVRCENGLSEQEQRSVEEEQPMFVATDSAVLVEGLDNSDAIPVSIHEKQEESSAEGLEMLENDGSEMEVQEQEKRSLEEQPMFAAASGNDSAVLMESRDSSEALQVTNQEKQEESSAEAREMIEVGGFENEASEQEQRSIEEKQAMFGAADSNDSAVLTECQDTSETLPVTNQEKQEESSAEAQEMIEVGRFEDEASVQERRSVKEKQAIFGAADSNDSAVLMESQDSSEPLPMTDQEEQEESSAEAQEVIEVGGFENEAIQQEQRSVEEKQTMFVAADSNDSAVLTESQDTSEALPVTNQEKQEESSAEAQEVIEVGGFENEAIQQEQRSVEEKQTMFVAADSNDSAVLTESQDTSEALPVTNQEKQEESSAEAQEVIEVGGFENEAIQQEQRSVEEKQTRFVAADSNDSAVLTESQDISEALPVTNQEMQEESSAEAQEVIEVGGFENEAIQQEQRSVEEKQTMFVAADSNDSAVLTESQDTSEALPVTNQEMQEESSPECLETLEDDRFESEIIQQEQRSVEEKQFMFGAADSNDSAVLIESQDSSEAMPVTNHKKQEESSAEALEMVEVGKFENEAREQEQRSIEEKQTMLVGADSNDSAVLTESRDTSEALPVTIQEKQEESSAEPLMIEVASFKNEASEQEQRSVEEKQTMFVGADSNDLAVLIESRDTSESFPFTNQETQEESSPEALEMLEDDRAESEIIQQEQRYLEEKQPIFVAADSNDSAVLMESLENSKPCPVTNQEKQEESSAEVAADVLPSFQTSHVPAMQDSSVCPAKGLVTDDGVGEEVHPITSLGPVVPSGVTPENEVEELDNKEYSVSGHSTELFEELAKSEGFDRVNGMDEQGQMLASDEASQLYSQLQTRHVLSIQDSSFDQAEETMSDENAGEVVDPDSRHSLKGASPIITGGNEQEKRRGEADRSFDGNIDVDSVPETNTESIDFNKQNSPSQAEISCDGAQAQNNDLIMEVAALDCRGPCEKVGHDDAIGSETAETNSEALPLSGSRQPMEHSCNVSQASSPTHSINDEFPASHQNGMHRDSSSDVTQTQTADQDDSATGLKALPLPEKSCLMANGQSKSMVSALQASAPETADVHEAAPTLFPELGEQPLSSSHQDHLWEEQAETYPKGSGVTAAHLEEAAIDAIHSPTPSATSPDDQILPALGPVTNTLPDVVAHSSTVENGSTIDGKTEKSKSRTQLRNLLAEDASMVSNGSISTGAEDSPLKRLFSRLMGNPTKSGEKEIKQVKKRKPSVWNACIGVSAVR